MSIKTPYIFCFSPQITEYATPSGVLRQSVVSVIGTFSYLQTFESEIFMSETLLHKMECAGECWPPSSGHLHTATSVFDKFVRLTEKEP